MSSRFRKYRSELRLSYVLAYLENIESRKEAKTGSAPMDVDALAAAASQMQASLASLAKAKGKGKGGGKSGHGKRKGPPLTWEQLSAVDANMTRVAMLLAKEYGYGMQEPKKSEGD